MTDEQNQELWGSPFDDLLGARAQPAPAPKVFGVTPQDVSLWPGQQQGMDTCAIRCQEFILRQFTGVVTSEAALVNESFAHGWYLPGQGTPPQFVGNLLEAHGIAVNRYANATVFNLVSELAQGHKVMVGVDSGELWRDNPLREWLEDYYRLDKADHLVVVTGVDTSDPSHIRVIVNDPGTGQVAASYPLEQFADAWADSHFYLVATHDPAPQWLPEMVNFDYVRGHIAQVAGIPYPAFAQLADQSPQAEALLSTYL